MIKKLTTLAFMAALPFLAATQPHLPKVENKAFGPSEVLEYRVHYGFIDAGTARLEVDPILKNLGGRTCYRVVGTGKSVGAFDWFFKVRDHYESYIDSEAMVPWLFIRRIEEGSYSKKQNVSFNHFRSTATSEKKTITTPGQVQDLISAFYYSRTLDFTNAAVGDTFLIHTYLDDEVFPMVIKYTGKEKIKTKAGTFRCIVFKPYLLEGRVFKEKEGMTVWVTDDKNRIPVRAQADILVGSIKMDLTKYSGLSNPIALLK
ncbi:MAG: DUF3108 domain-containing protein [Bacteroidia bacterium]|nr:DUF3108 domain-containing protein [Bacteroidia bacterium]